MTFPFTPDRGLIIVRAEIEGSSGNALVRLALDTGATDTLVNTGMLVAIGYNPATAPTRVQVTTGSGIEFVPRLPVVRLASLGKERKPFQVLCHTLPPSAGVDGLLGLDFLRSETLTIDFKSGRITLP